MNTKSHPDSERLIAYRQGILSADQIADVQAHLATCEDCRTMAESSGGDVPSTVGYIAEPKKMVAGHELQRELARGGLGIVYLAYHPHLLDFRAIKRPLMRPGHDRNLLLERFRREVEAVGSLRHDHIIRAHDAGADADGPYLVMEYLDGESLSALVKERGPLAVHQACELIRQAALGLQAAHERGLVHRDVKPSNLMLARVNNGMARVVVIDWGLVKRARGAGKEAGLTVVQTTMGTPDFMSPEQIRDSHSVDLRADLYSLGVTLYYLLVGKAPFQDWRGQDKLLAQQREPFPLLANLRADVPREVLAILNKMVDKDPARRYASAREVANALQPFCDGARVLDLLERKDAPPPARRRRIGWRALAAACLVPLMLALVLTVWALRSPGQRKVADDPKGQVTPGVLSEGSASPVKMKDSHSGYCSSLAFMPDGLHAVSESGGGSVYVWDLKTRESHSWLHFLGQSDKEMAGMVAVSPDGNHLVAAGLNTFPREMYFLSRYDATPPYAVKDKMFATFGKMGPALAFSPKGTELAAVDLPKLFGEPQIRIIDVKTGARKEFSCPSAVNSLAFSPDGAFLLGGGDDKKIRLWRWQAKKLERTFSGHGGAVSQVAFSADGKRVFSASNEDDTLRRWNNDQDAGKEELKISLRQTAGKMLCASFWPGGRALTGHVDGSVVLWDLEQGQKLKRYAHKDVQITAVAISPDGHHALAAHSDRSVYLYRLPAP
jgi:serine/threonine protein kinase